ncbi:hypothetical protein CSU65_004559 [Salmonella enterica subsp. diarizonae]|nr:hypothetical protein [Salmonella enterica subsp. diarizonae]
MNKISIVIAGPAYREFDIYYSIKLLRTHFPESEIILSSNDHLLLTHANRLGVFDKIVTVENSGELPSLKFESVSDRGQPIVCNNINKQIKTSLHGILEASHDLVLKIRTDQILMQNHIISLWNLIKDIPNDNKKTKGRIITSSIFSINPRFSERMPYHISDMLQFGFKEDLIRYYSAPEYPFDYSVWYETHIYASHSNRNENIFRSKYAVEQWLTMNYIFGVNTPFPIKYHNDISHKIIKDFEYIFPDFFIIAHPKDISLRASKFNSAMNYVNNQCYSTYDSLMFLKEKYKLSEHILSNYKAMGLNKKIYKHLNAILNSYLIHIVIRHLPVSIRKFLKRILR